MENSNRFSRIKEEDLKRLLWYFHREHWQKQILINSIQNNDKPTKKRLSLFRGADKISNGPASIFVSPSSTTTSAKSMFLPRKREWKKTGASCWCSAVSLPLDMWLNSESAENHLENFVTRAIWYSVYLITEFRASSLSAAIASNSELTIYSSFNSLEVMVVIGDILECWVEKRSLLLTSKSPRPWSIIEKFRMESNSVHLVWNFKVLEKHWMENDKRISLVTAIVTIRWYERSVFNRFCCNISNVQLNLSVTAATIFIGFNQ